MLMVLPCCRASAGVRLARKADGRASAYEIGASSRGPHLCLQALHGILQLRHAGHGARGLRSSRGFGRGWPPSAPTRSVAAVRQTVWQTVWPRSPVGQAGSVQSRARGAQVHPRSPTTKHPVNTFDTHALSSSRVGYKTRHRWATLPSSPVCASPTNDLVPTRRPCASAAASAGAALMAAELFSSAAGSGSAGRAVKLPGQ
jgi:hypothetical protein